MDNKESLISVKRSLNSVLFLIPQAARNVLEVLRSARAVAWDDAQAEEKALFAQQEALLGKFCKDIELAGRGVWDLAQVRLEELVVECEELRATLDREASEQGTKEFRNQLEQGLLPVEDAKAKAKRLAHVLADGAISKAPGGPESTSPDGEGQHGEAR